MPVTRGQLQRMDAAKKHVELELAEVEEQFNEIGILLQGPSVDVTAAGAVYQTLDFQINLFMEALKSYLELLRTNGLDDEYRNVTKLRNDIIKRRFRATADLNNVTAAVGAGSATGVHVPTHQEHYRVKYPQRELVKFDGDVRNWRSFWASFQEIDADGGIPAIEKYHLLLQSMVAASRPYQIVKSYPADGTSYGLARDELKDKFGRTKTIVKVYIRDLLKQVVENSKEKKGDFTQVVTTLSAQIRSLEQLGLTQENSGIILYPILECCIPQEVLTRYLQKPGVKEDVAELLDFLNQEVRRLDETALAQGSFEDDSKKLQNKSFKGQKNGSTKSPAPTAATFVNSEEKSKGSCGFCGGYKHATADCRKAKNMTLAERKGALKENGCCFRCLTYGHGAKQCYKKVVCMICKKSHHTLMCWESAKEEKGESASSKQPSEKTTQEASEKEQPNKKAEKSTGLSNYISRPEVFLQTLYIKMHGLRGSKTIRAMFDPGSQCTYFKSSLQSELGFPFLGKEKVIHQTFGGSLSEETDHAVYTIEVSGIHSPHTDKYHFRASAIDKIATGIIAPTYGSWWKECERKGIRLTDINGEEADIDLLIGNEISPYLKQGLSSTLLQAGLVATETRIGWILEGKVKGSESRQSTKSMICINMCLSKMDVSQLWALETIGIRESPDPQSRVELEQAAMEHFRTTVRQDSSGRFEVHLPWINGHRELPRNKDVALARLQKTTKDLLRDGHLEAYHEVFKSWLSEGIIERVSQNVNLSPSAKCIHYIPHRAVYKPNSTTPVRPVFNASCKKNDEPSLNDCLEVGPNLLEVIPSIMTGFRRERVGVVSDIRKAFLQIKVTERDRDSLRFLWWTDENNRKEVVEYRHCRVVFGVTSSPFLLGAVLKLLLEKNQSFYPDAVEVLQRSFYVDNCCTSFSTMEEAATFETQARSLLATGCFDLRGWEVGTCEEENQVSVLGMTWNRKYDTLQFDLAHFKEKFKVGSTKRSVISFASIIFDPLGLLSPFTIVAKMLFKRICLDQRKFGSDAVLPEEYVTELERWKNEALKVDQVKIQRFLGLSAGTISIHTFCDASKESYACCCYLRVEGETVSVQLIQARARVTPAKNITIPRAELLACLLGARLTATIKEDLRIPDVPATYWSDSTTAITWISKTDANWAVWVNNRGTEIRRLTNPNLWRHVPGDMNPADLPSRGTTIERLIKTRWWEGPDWLLGDPSSFPHSNPDVDEEIVNRERKKNVISAIAVNRSVNFIDKLVRLGDYTRVLRFVAFVIRYVRRKFLQKAKPADGTISIITADEFMEAEKFVIRQIQKSTWENKLPKEIKCEVAEDDIIRVVTRLVHGVDDVAFQRPALLPGNHPLVKMMIYKQHCQNSHAGVQFMQSRLRDKFWIINSRRTIRNIVHGCPVCRRFIAKRASVQEAPLPAHRVNQSRCFEVTGVDLAGPLFLKNGEKVWITIFTCAVYRAIHLEIVSSLSTAAFLMAFRKFVARRGRPSVIYSDNGTNFHGCANLFKRVDWEKVQSFTAMEEIKWVFNPPAAPWWGGFWERLVGLVKQLLRRNLGKRTVDYSELDVLVTEVEAVMNDRPLTYISEEADDLKELTPAMFLKDLPVSGLPELDVAAVELNRRLRYIQRMKEELRRRFRSEYLGQLVNKKKQEKNTTLKPGDVVLIEAENKKRWEWPMGVILETFAGRDGVFRTARVRTAQGEVVRPFQRLFPLEVRSESDLPYKAEVKLERMSTLKMEENDPPKEEDVEEKGAVVTKSGRRSTKPDRFKS